MQFVYYSTCIIAYIYMSGEILLSLELLHAACTPNYCIAIAIAVFRLKFGIARFYALLLEC